MSNHTKLPVKAYHASITDGASIVGANGGDTVRSDTPRTVEVSLQVDF
jgi:hypothetical protein